MTGINMLWARIGLGSIVTIYLSISAQQDSCFHRDILMIASCWGIICYIKIQNKLLQSAMDLILVAACGKIWLLLIAISDSVWDPPESKIS